MKKGAIGWGQILSGVIVVFLIVGLSLLAWNKIFVPGEKISEIAACENNPLTDGKCVENETVCKKLNGKNVGKLGCNSDEDSEDYICCVTT